MIVSVLLTLGGLIIFAVGLPELGLDFQSENFVLVCGGLGVTVTGAVLAWLANKVLKRKVSFLPSS